MKLEESSVEYDKRTKSIMSQCEEGICVVELRDSDGNVVHFEVKVLIIYINVQFYSFALQMFTAELKIK